MPHYRNALPQLSGDVFLTDAGVETDLIFNHGIEIREFAAFTLRATSTARRCSRRSSSGARTTRSKRRTTASRATSSSVERRP